jgi:hypothetical protein
MELAQRAGEVLPESAYESSAAVSSYIEAKRGAAAPYTSAPNGAQPYAGAGAPYSGAPRNGAPLGGYAGGQSEGYNTAGGAFNTGGGADSAPTPKQLNYLVSLAVRHRSGISYEALSNRRACSELIDELLGKGQSAAPRGGAPVAVPPPAGPTLFNDADIPF